jgi:hypothetical protein
MPAEQVLGPVTALLEGYPETLLWVHLTNPLAVIGTPGFPDLLIIGPQTGQILWRECKPHPGARLRTGQISWKYAVLAVGGNYGVWMREQLDSGQIAAELAAAAGLT